MFIIIGKRDLNAVTVALLYSVAVNVLFPILILILLPVGLVLLLWPTPGVLLLREVQPISDRAKNRSTSKCFIIVDLECQLIKLPGVLLVQSTVTAGN